MTPFKSLFQRLSTFVALVAIFLCPLFLAQAQTLTTDKEDYGPTEAVLFSGSGYQPSYTYQLGVQSVNGYQTQNPVTTNPLGELFYQYQLDGIYRPTYSAVIQDGDATVSSVNFTDKPQVNLDQCANGGIGSPAVPCTQAASAWQNGNLGQSQAHYQEGDTVPYRAIVTGVSAGEIYTVKLEYDTTKSGKHAIDYLRTYNQTEITANPCTGVVGAACGAPTTFAIPADPLVSLQQPGNFTLFNGSITEVSPYTVSGSYAGDSSTSVIVKFTASANGTAVLAWGGHIATRSDWGAANSAINISGSPYHMRVVDFTCSNVSNCGSGNQDRSLSAEAIIFPSSITIRKVASPQTGSSFSFTGSPSPLINFSLVGDGGAQSTKTFSNIKTFQTYNVSEVSSRGWQLQSLSCSASQNGGSSTVNGSSVSINLKEGEDVTCTYTNEQQLAQLIVIKHVINDDGGTAEAGDFIMDIGGIPVVGSPTFSGAEAPGTSSTVMAGDYSVTESGPSGYKATFSADCSTTIAPGETKTCTITNDDIAPKLTVTKVVVNDNGGTKQVSDFPLHVGATSVVSGEENEFDAGEYHISELSNAAYTMTTDGDCDEDGDITLELGDVKSCTLTNDDKPARLTVIKHVINDNGGDKDAADFTMHVDGTNVSDAGFLGSEDGTTVTLDAGAYSVTESNLFGYAQSIGENCSGTIEAGESKTCTITNDDIAPKLTVIKHVENAFGGPLSAEDFMLHVDGANVSPASFVGSESGTIVTLNAGSYSVSEDSVSGYEGVLGDDCSGELEVGDTVSCTVVNSDLPASLHGMKFEDHNGNGIKDSGDQGLGGWTIFIDSNNSGSFDVGEPTTVTDASGNYHFTQLSAGSYRVREMNKSGWTQTSAQPADLVLVNGQNVENVNFGNFQLVSIGGYKWHDIDGSGTLDAEEEKLLGWMMFVDTNGNQTFDGGEAFASTNASGNYSIASVGPVNGQVCEVMKNGWSQTYPTLSTGALCHPIVTESGVNITGKNFGNMNEHEGTIGFWKNWNKHNKYPQSTINAWMNQIDIASIKWLIPAGYTKDTAGLVKIITDATKSCNTQFSQLDCAKNKFLAQYLVTRLNVLSGKKSVANTYNLSSQSAVASYLGVSVSNAQLGTLFTKTEAIAGSPTRQQFLNLASLYDFINNQGI